MTPEAIPPIDRIKAAMNNGLVRYADPLLEESIAAVEAAIRDGDNRVATARQVALNDARLQLCDAMGLPYSMSWARLLAWAGGHLKANGEPPGVYVPSVPSGGSEAAALRQARSGKAKADVLAVFEYLCARGACGATDDEVQVALSMNPSTERPRRRGLVLSGIVMAGSEKRPTRTGCSAQVWIVCSHPLSVWLTHRKYPAGLVSR